MCRLRDGGTRLRALRRASDRVPSGGSICASRVRSRSSRSSCSRRSSSGTSSPDVAGRGMRSASRISRCSDSVAPRLSARREHAIAGARLRRPRAALRRRRAAAGRRASCRWRTRRSCSSLDTSRSMLSSDVAPTRLGAAKQAAHSFLDRVPDRLRIGLVTFAGDVSVAAFPDARSRAAPRLCRGESADGRPEAARRSATRSCARSSSPETPFGERGLSSPERCAGMDTESAVTILFLSDGRQNRGLIPPEQGAAAAKGAGIPVFTVALGTDRPDRGGFGSGVASTALPTGRRSGRSRARPEASTSRRARRRRCPPPITTSARVSAVPSGRRRSRSCSWPRAGIALAAAAGAVALLGARPLAWESRSPRV